MKKYSPQKLRDDQQGPQDLQGNFPIQKFSPQDLRENPQELRKNSLCKSKSRKNCDTFFHPARFFVSLADKNYEKSCGLCASLIETQLEDRYKYGTDIFKELNERGVDVSYDKTIRTIRDNFKTVNSPFKFSITKENINKRVTWINDHSTWRTAKWLKVVWSDEKAFELFPQGGQLHAKILPDESPEDFPRLKIQKGGEKVMFFFGGGYLNVAKFT